MHLDRDESVPGAGLAAAPLDVEGEPPRTVPPRARLGELREELTDRAEGARVGRGIGARAPPDRRLVDRDHLVEHLPSRERVVRTRFDPAAPEMLRERGIDRVDDQARLARPGDAGDARHGAEGDVDVDAPEAVRPRPAHPDRPPDAAPTPRRDRDLLRTRPGTAGVPPG